MEAVIRHATEADLAAINAIYNSYIVGRHTSFDLEPWPLAQRREWFAKYAQTGRYQVLVALDADRVVGFASSSPFRDKAGYDTSVETTIVLEEAATGLGLGPRLLAALLRRLVLEPIHRAYALIALPNDTSIRLHERFAYRTVGTLDEVGHKLDDFHSVLIMERNMSDPADPMRPHDEPHAAGG
ncbi:MAG: GNAT family N-acetyltransferase [Acidimicrobiia bacterium]|nr:GNAT family N-acetyltransferase [Acidimicrobiia bacterium]